MSKFFLNLIVFVILSTLSIFSANVIVSDTIVNKVSQNNDLMDWQIVVSTVGVDECDSIDEVGTIYEQDEVDTKPQFGKGNNELEAYINSDLRYPTIAAENDVQGVVLVAFIITKEGCVKEVSIVESLDLSCDREALRLVKYMPKWIPGVLKNENVAVTYSLPIVFKLKN